MESKKNVGIYRTLCKQVQRSIEQNLYSLIKIDGTLNVSRKINYGHFSLLVTKR